MPARIYFAKNTLQDLELVEIVPTQANKRIPYYINIYYNILKL